VFAFRGSPWLLHRLTYRRTNHINLHVRGYEEEGTTTTPFDRSGPGSIAERSATQGKTRGR
jgi:phosphoketolase